jgi:hypothetical protein
MAKTKTLLGISAVAAVALAAVACHPALDLQGISAAFIKCRPSEVVVGNEETYGGLREWDALYKDEEWHCVRAARVRTSTPWVATECRRVGPDSASAVAGQNTGATGMRHAERPVPTIPAGVASGSLSDHQTGE